MKILGFQVWYLVG